MPSDFSYNATNHGFHTVQSRTRYFLPPPPKKNILDDDERLVVGKGERRNVKERVAMKRLKGRASVREGKGDETNIIASAITCNTQNITAPSCTLYIICTLKVYCNERAAAVQCSRASKALSLRQHQIGHKNIQRWCHKQHHIFCPCCQLFIFFAKKIMCRLSGILGSSAN